MTAALEVVITAPVASFRNPLYAAAQVGLPCPPPATVGGLLAGAVGGWSWVARELRFAMAFSAGGSGTDVETYHPLLAGRGSGAPTPKDRDFLADVSLTVWLFDDLERWRHALRRPVWPLRLGRSQDLASARSELVELADSPGRQGHAVIPAQAGGSGTLLRLPTAISLDRARIRWDAYYHHEHGSDLMLRSGLCTVDGRAVVPLAGLHPDQFADVPAAG
jgi:CRISPR-associated Cas5-like protein